MNFSNQMLLLGAISGTVWRLYRAWVWRLALALTVALEQPRGWWEAARRIE